MTLLRDERWPVARLMPITSSTGIEAKERNAASALLAVIAPAEREIADAPKPVEQALNRAYDEAEAS